MSSLPFAGVADEYARYRPGYPEPFLQEVLSRTNTRRRSLVDLGCGTGEVALPLSSVFEQVVAADIDGDMIAQAEQKTSSHGIENITWVVSKAEDLELPETIDLVTSGRAFHWMDRPLLAARCFERLADDGAIGIFGGDLAPWDPTEEWHAAATGVMDRWVGPQPLTGASTAAFKQEHVDALAGAGFRIEEYEYAEPRTWTVEEYAGYLHSTAFTAAVGDKRPEFDADLAEALASHTRDGVLTEKRRYYAVLGHKR